MQLFVLHKKMQHRGSAEAFTVFDLERSYTFIPSRSSAS
jgi:hypothetical protein